MAASGEPVPRDADHEQPPNETSPLLQSNNRDRSSSPSPPSSQRRSSAHDLLQALHRPPGSKRRWPSILALVSLCLLVILIIVLAFIAPSSVEQYAQQAAVFTPTSLSIASFTATGVRARVQGDFVLDSSRVTRKAIRDMGRFCTWIARKAETGQSQVEVSLPEFGNVVVGTAIVPGFEVDIRDGRTTHVDFTADLQPGNVDGIRQIATKWVDGELGQLRVLGKASVPLKSGIISLGKQALRQELLFAGDKIPSIPAYDIRKLNFREIDSPGSKGMAAEVSLLVENEYPIDFTLPSFGFDILVDNCVEADPYIKLADATTQSVHVLPKEQIEVNATGLVRQLPDVLTQDCPGSHESPLDILLGNYIHGKDNTIYVRGAASPSKDTPEWISDLISDITVPVPVPGKALGHLVKNFTLADTHFSLPDPFAEPGSPEASPRISANVVALVALPDEMNFSIDVSRVRADADVFYKKRKLGRLDLNKWQPAKSTRVEPSSKKDGPALKVESKVTDAPLNITDDDVLTDVIEAMLFGGKPVVLHVKAEIDVEVETTLGELTVRGLPAEGEVEVNALPRQPKHPDDALPFPPGIQPQIRDLRILSTTPSSLILGATVNITNPTSYTATIPYLNIHILTNDSLIGHATLRNIEVGAGVNPNLTVEATYAPLDLGGKKSRLKGRDLIGHYISGRNVSVTARLHKDSIPFLPHTGKVLGKRFAIDVPAPHLRVPRRKQPGEPDDGDDDEDKSGPHFIENALLHLLSSTATFTLLSPLPATTIVITSVNATAFYHSSVVGKILSDESFPVPPIDEDGNGVDTPKLPVDWNPTSVGYGAVKRALGGTLKLDAKATVGVKVGKWEELIDFHGKGIGAGVRL